MKPSAYLGTLLNKQVRVRLNDGSDYTGKLISVDGFMNVALQDCVDGGLKYQTAFLRGNNVFHISPISS
jgi:U6 snRNA-associated Sm-like protein LSm6